MLKSILWHFLFLAITFLSSVTLQFIIPKRIKFKSHIKISRMKNIRLVLSRYGSISNLGEENKNDNFGK
ncbi:hypothetical protein, partial [Epilithonimonas hominis]|uniref:hypothetical protein n=1 Tax=Epilithonimonas hominis TaxID=420404 RepID=UPI0028A177DA